MPKYATDLQPSDLVLCRSDAGDGGWSLHAPGSTDEAIACGEASPLTSGMAEFNADTNKWNRPNNNDYAIALNILDGLEREQTMLDSIDNK